MLSAHRFDSTHPSSKAVLNLFSGSLLNRVSWLCSSHIFLNAAVDSPVTRWVLFNARWPLVTPNATSSGLALAYLSTPQVSPLLVPLIFLGIHESNSMNSVLPSSDFTDPEQVIANIAGQPFFVMDVAALNMQEEELARVLGATDTTQNGPGALTWADPLQVEMHLGVTSRG
ncbi:hypothetical protein FISHEDRAFT_68803 [Fistulina hepatica ATCC 64428]|uniref:Uncharacterized protein n=1 Tax=Fistulina hepatica ATCC 64428 TaxID=1128425 RepID=A0A0D7AP02_9AGAR|nr:hypothetical protein FISHEDRAFT_68803 [Fistulina hepatica ATCC 64428]